MKADQLRNAAFHPKGAATIILIATYNLRSPNAIHNCRAQLD